jgi:microcystin-dependent protein
VTLTVDQLPQHNHGSSGVDVTATSHLAGGNLFADTSTSFNMYQAPSSNITAMATSSVDPAGGGQPHNNLQPYLAVNYIFCLQGIFPPRPPG